MERLKRRQDFVAAAKASYCAQGSVIVQSRQRGDEQPARVGFTATKKLGGAVIRNRVKRRLREAARQALAPAALHGHDYVLIGRATTAATPFDQLIRDLNSALKRLHGSPYRKPPKDQP